MAVGSVGRLPSVVPVGSRMRVSVLPPAPVAEDMGVSSGKQVTFTEDLSGPVSVCDSQLASESSGHGDLQASGSALWAALPS